MKAEGRGSCNSCRLFLMRDRLLLVRPGGRTAPFASARADASGRCRRTCPPCRWPRWWTWSATRPRSARPPRPSAGGRWTRPGRRRLQMWSGSSCSTHFESRQSCCWLLPKWRKKLSLSALNSCSMVSRRQNRNESMTTIRRHKMMRPGTVWYSSISSITSTSNWKKRGHFSIYHNWIRIEIMAILNEPSSRCRVVSGEERRPATWWRSRFCTLAPFWSPPTPWREVTAAAWTRTGNGKNKSFNCVIATRYIKTVCAGRYSTWENISSMSPSVPSHGQPKPLAEKMAWCRLVASRARSSQVRSPRRRRVMGWDWHVLA